MTPEAQLIAIAEALGLEILHAAGTAKAMVRKRLCTGADSTDWKVMPDYLSDLNAMHAAEKASINASNEAYYRGFLVIACGEWKFHRASAAQRAEAFLRTLGRWEE